MMVVRQQETDIGRYVRHPACDVIHGDADGFVCPRCAQLHRADQFASRPRALLPSVPRGSLVTSHLHAVAAVGSQDAADGDHARDQSRQDRDHHRQ